MQRLTPEDNIVKSIAPDVLIGLALGRRGEVASSYDSLGIHIMTYAANLINEKNEPVVDITHLNHHTTMESITSLQVLQRNELRERYDWNGQDVFGYSNAQSPDAVYECTVKSKDGTRSRKFLIFFESDPSDKRFELRKVAMKMWQATDVCRIRSKTEGDNPELPAYTVRANLKWYHNEIFKNYQLTLEEVKRIYKEKYSKQKGKRWDKLSDREIFEIQTKINHVKRGGQNIDLLNMYLREMCTSMVHVFYEIIKHTLNVCEFSNEPSVLLGEFYEKNKMWDIHVFIGNFALKSKSELHMVNKNDPLRGERTWYYNEQCLGPSEKAKERRQSHPRITKNLEEDTILDLPLGFVATPMWTYTDASGTSLEAQQDCYLCQSLFNEMTMNAREPALLNHWQSWKTDLKSKTVTKKDYMDLTIIGIERVNLRSVSELLTAKVRKTQKLKTRIDEKMQEIQEIGSIISISNEYNALDRTIDKRELELMAFKRRIKRQAKTIREEEDNDDSADENFLEGVADRELEAEIKKANQEQVDIRKLKQTLRDLKKKMNAIRKLQRDIQGIRLNMSTISKEDMKFTGMWYLADIIYLFDQGNQFIENILTVNSLNLVDETKSQFRCSLFDLNYSTPPKWNKGGFNGLAQWEHFNQPWYKVVVEPFMNVMENFILSSIQTLTWNSVNHALDIDMINVIRSVRKKPSSKLFQPLTRSHLQSQPDETKTDFNKMSLTRICLKSLSNTLPSEGKDMEELRAYLDKFHVPHAFTFFRMIRCTNIIALQEISRQCFSDPELKKRFDKYLSMMPLGMQTEILYILTDVRTGVSQKQSRPTASDSDSDSVEIVDSRSPSPDAGTGDDGDGSDGGDDDDIHDDRGESPALQSASDQLPAGDNVLQIENYPFKPRPTYQYVYDFFKTSKDLYVWFPDLVNDREHPSHLAPGWHKVAALTRPSKKHRRTEPNFYEMKFDVSEFRGADYGEKQLNHERYNSKSLPWSFSLPRSLYYPANPQGNWTVLYTNVVTINDTAEIMQPDGNCLYRAIAWYDDEKYRDEPEQTIRVQKYRDECGLYYTELATQNEINQHGFKNWEELEKYIQGIYGTAWGTHSELAILSKEHRINYRVYQPIPGKRNKFYLVYQENFDGVEKTGYYRYTGRHYDVLRVE